MTTGSVDAEGLLAEVRAVALSYPDSFEEQPWGDLAVKVRGKVFAFYGVRDGRFSITVKLPRSQPSALASPHVEPTHYGMGKHGWVTARWPDPDEVDLPTVLGWLEESFRAVAPKTLARTVPEGGPVPAEVRELPTVPEGAPRVVVVSDDTLRAARCVRGLAERGVQGVRASTSDLDALADTDAHALIVDLGRSASIALAVAGELAVLRFDCPLVLAGIRDARAEASAREALPAAAAWLREPPGDAAVLDAALAALPT